MEFRNLTPFPAMAFDCLDQRDQRFHTLVMRLTFELQDDGMLSLTPLQTPLVMTDEFYGEVNRSSVRQESDLAPYKPHTDVIVLANACAPGGRSSPRFVVALKINGRPVAPDLPAQPGGLSPMQHADPERIARWREECARLKAEAAEGPVVLRKVLAITGPREWRKRSPLTRALSMFTLPRWKLTEPLPAATLPVRYEYAFGGENKILVTEAAAKRVSEQHRLPGRVPQPVATGTGESPDAIAHSVLEQNPLGRGYAEPWYLSAAKVTHLPAPQIESPHDLINPFGNAYVPQGFGVVGRAWKPRLALAGTYDKQWLEQRHPRLPADFDFAYWNGAPSDQQVKPHLSGNETITLCNLYPAGAGTVWDAAGNNCLSFALPGHLPFALVRFEDGRIGELPAKLDTLIIDAAPDVGDPYKKISVVCVWRATVATIPAVRVMEARMLTHADVVGLGDPPPSTRQGSVPDLAVVPN